MSITAITKDANSRIVSWKEDDYSYTLVRDAAGKPLLVRGSSAGRPVVSAEFKYRVSDGSFSGLVGNVNSLLVQTIVLDAAGLSGATAAAVPDTVAVTASRALTNDDAGKTLDCVNAGITLTVPAGLTLKPGVIVLKHSAGSSIAFSGAATGNGSASTISLTNQMTAIVPGSSADAYRVGV